MQFTLMKELPGFKPGEVLDLELDEDGRYRHASGFWMDAQVLDAHPSFQSVDNPETFYCLAPSGELKDMAELPVADQLVLHEKGAAIKGEDKANAAASKLKQEIASSKVGAAVAAAIAEAAVDAPLDVKVGK